MDLRKFVFSSYLSVGAAILTISFSQTTLAAELLPDPVTAWYEALQQGDEEKIDALLDDAATIELKDLGITQSKTEFIEALDEWTELNGDASLLTRMNKIDGNEITVDVCYRFTSNEVQTIETFYLTDNQINKSVQEQISETCDGF